MYDKTKQAKIENTHKSAKYIKDTHGQHKSDSKRESIHSLPIMLIDYLHYAC